MLRTGLRTRNVALAGACALIGAGVTAGPAGAFENARFSGAVEVTSVDGRWGPRSSDGRRYVLNMRLSLPRELNTQVGTASYAAVGGIVVCRSALRLVELDGNAQGTMAYFAVLAESRRSPSVRGASRGKRRAITRARKWCRGGTWRMTVVGPAYAFASEFPLDDDPELLRVGSARSAWHELTRRP